MLIEPYFPGRSLKNFPDLYKDLESHFDLLFDQVLDQRWFELTPRYRVSGGLKIAFRDIFYYIDRLYDHAPRSVIDVGCGENTFTRWFPNIVGLEPDPSSWSKADIVARFDSDWSQNHANHYDCGMAINSLHFCDWQDIGSQIHLAMNIVKDRFLFTMNFDRVENCPTAESLDLAQQLRHQLATLPYDLVLFDHLIKSQASYLSQKKDHPFYYLNGTVRFMLQKKQI